MRKSRCHPLSPKVSLSWLPCSAAAKQLGEGGSGGGGLYANEMLTDPATITNHQSDLISWLTSWMSVWLATYQANPSPAAPLVSAPTTLHIHNSLLGLRHWSMTVGAVCWCPRVKLFKIALNSSSNHNSQHFFFFFYTQTNTRLHKYSRAHSPWMVNSYNSVGCIRWHHFEG